MLCRLRRIQEQTFGGWCAMDGDDDPYLQIDFGQEAVITGVATQGLDYPLGNWVKKYSLNYSCDGGDSWKTYQSFDKHMVNIHIETALIERSLAVPLRTTTATVVNDNSFKKKNTKTGENIFLNPKYPVIQGKSKRKNYKTKTKKKQCFLGENI